MARRLTPEHAQTGPANIGHNVGDLKNIIRECAKSMLAIDNERSELNDQAGDIRKRLNDAGITTQSFQYGYKVYKMEAEARDSYQDGVRLVFDALGVGTQGAIFKPEDIPQYPANAAPASNVQQLKPGKEAKPAEAKAPAPAADPDQDLSDAGKPAAIFGEPEPIAGAPARDVPALMDAYAAAADKHCKSDELLILQEAHGGFIAMDTDYDAIMEAGLPIDESRVFEVKSPSGRAVNCLVMKASELPEIVGAMTASGYGVAVAKADGSADMHAGEAVA